MSRFIRLYSRRQWRIAGLLLISYIVVAVAATRFIPAAAQLYPGVAIALVALYFGGWRLFPVAYLAALLAGIIAGITVPLLVIIPILITLQATVGASMLRMAHFDPLFRRRRDAFYLIGMVFVISLIGPTLAAIAAAVTQYSAYSFSDWGDAYAATVFSFLIATPFLLRWFTKPWFSRPLKEVIETAAVLFALVAVSAALFTFRVQTVFGIPLVYFLLFVLFLIALRLRPRFVTLSLLVTSIFAITSAMAATDAVQDTVTRLFGMESFLIALSIVFLIIAALEEELRRNANLMRSQLATLENAVARVSSESRAKNDFIAILAHELRNPLAPVVSAIELLKLNPARNPEEEEALDMMTDRMNVVRRLLDDLLDISRISEGKVALKEERVELEAVLKRAILSTGHHRKQMHQELVVHPPKTPLYVLGDPLRLEQVFSNLLTNASKYSDSGDTITIRTREMNGIAEIEIADEGVGLSESTLDAIFVPFHQLGQDERKSKGLGIGLALVKSFVEMHAGTVTAASDGLGTGSRFTVRIPLLGTGAAPHKSKAMSLLQSRFSIRGDEPLVLVIDDNDTASGSLGRLLEIEGCSVIYAYQAEQAIEQAESLAPRVVFLDVDMAGEDGFAIARSLRERGFMGHFVAITKHPVRDVKARDRDSLFKHYLAKPVGLSDLKRILPELT